MAKDQELIDAARTGAVFGYENGYRHAIAGLREFIEKVDDAELAKIGSDAKKYARIFVRGLEEFAQQHKDEFIKNFRCEVIADHGIVRFQ